jgi:hypothetical protein
MKILINTGTSGDDTVVIATDEGEIKLTVTEARRLATVIAFVAAEARKGNSYEEAIEI